MATNKPKVRTWYDVQMAIAAIAMSLTLALWNLFAGPDREQAARKMVEGTQATPPLPPTETPVVSLSPTPMPIVKIIFGNGTTPQPSGPSSQPDNSKKGRRNQDGGGGGGGGGGKGGGGGGGSTKGS
jgi:uncharacterized membrane protein YgcG